MARRDQPELFLPLSRIVENTPTVRDFRFDLEGAELDFMPGQFVTIAADLPLHGRVRRAYSIASSPTERGHFDLCIKKFEDGVLSRFLFEHVEPGHRFAVQGPFGKFVWNEDHGTRLALIAAGTGIAPLQCMIRYARAKGLAVDMGLLFSNRRFEEIIYREEIDRLAREMPGFFVRYTLTRGAPAGWQGYARRIDRAMIAETFPDAKDRLCYICGAPEMVNETAAHLESLGVPKTRVRTEKYD
jgi:ferredoxin-NADP reductase